MDNRKEQKWPEQGHNTDKQQWGSGYTILRNHCIQSGNLYRGRVLVKYEGSIRVLLGMWGLWNLPPIYLLSGRDQRRQWHPLQCSCLENLMDRGAWWAAVHGVAKSQTRRSDFTFTFPFHALEKEMATHSSALAWRIPGTGEPGGLPSMGLHIVGYHCSDLAAAAAAGRDKRYVSAKWGLSKKEGVSGS